MEKEGITKDLIIKDSRCWIKGDSLYHNVSEKFEIVNYPIEPNEIECWIDYKEEIEIDGKKYFLKKESRFEKFADTIDKVIDFCEMAKEKDEKIYWLYSH